MPRLANLLHPILSGTAGSLATLVGEHFFSAGSGWGWAALVRLAAGLLLFGLLNHLLYKFKFNSYQLNGATVTTLAIFLTQNVVIGLTKLEQVGWKWWAGVVLITLGVGVLYRDKDAAQNAAAQRLAKQL